jgi:hypothetical protein
MGFDIGTIGQGAAAQGAGAILGIALGAYNDNRQEIQNRKLMNQQMAAQKSMTDYNTSKQLEMWKATSYPAQIEQLKKAGLNPGLIYGMGGGGGQTAQVNTGHVDTATAQQNPGEAQAMAGMGIQAGMMAAQVELMKAEARKANAEAANQETGVPKQIEATTGKLIADTGNVQMDTKLKEIQTRIANTQAQVQQGTIEEQISKITADAATATEEAMQMGIKTNIDRATMNTAIDQIKMNYVATMIENALKKAQTAKTGQETTLLSQENKSYIERLTAELSRISHQNYADIHGTGAAEQQAQTAATKQAWEQFLHDMPDTDKLPLEAIEKAAQAIFLKNIINAAPTRNPIGYK